MAKKKLRSSLAVLITLVMVLTMFSNGVMAAITSVTTKVKYSQTECRTTLLKLINDYRQSGDGWYWNVGNTSKTYTGVMNTCSYDYNLEQIAMQRAAEVAATFSHTRPNDSSWQLLGYNGTYSGGECLAAGQYSPEDVFTAWKEENELYEGQGHRRIMLGKYTAVGIAHAEINGVNFWVLEFGRTYSNAAQTPAIDFEVTRSVDLDLSMSSLYVSPSFSYKNVTYGSSADLPTVLVGLRSFNYWGNGLDVSGDATVTWSSDDSTIVSVSNGKMNAVNAGTTNVTCTATAYGLSSTASVKVTVTAKSLSTTTFELDSTSYTYTGSAIEPPVTVTDGSKTLVENVDYTVAYDKNTNVPLYTNSYYQPVVKVTGKGNYSGTVSKYFTINPYDISNCTVTDSKSSYPYSGSTIKPELAIKRGTTELTTSDYTLTASGKTPGTYDYTITGKGNYTGTYTGTYVVSKKKLTDVTFSGMGSYTYSGSEIKPYFTLTSGGSSISSSYYDVTYSNNKNAGEGTITVTGKGVYDFSASTTFTISPRTLNSNYVAFTTGYTTYTYNGTPVEPEFTIAYGVTPLVKGTDYDVTYTNNSAVGSATATITFKGNYTGTATKYFTIKAAPTPTPTATPKPTVTPTTKPTVKPTAIPAVRPTAAPTNAPVVVPTTSPSKVTLTDINFDLFDDTYTYDGTAKEPFFWLFSGDNYIYPDCYDVTYSNNINAGTATITVTGTGNYSISASTTFTISPARPGLSAVNFTSNGTELEFTITYGSKTLVKGTDYTVEYANNSAPGYATATVTYKGNYAGSVEVTYYNSSTQETTPTTAPGVTTTPKPTSSPVATPEAETGVAGFVERLYTVAMGRESDPSGKAYWENEVKVNGKTGADLGLSFLLSEEFLGKNMSTDQFLDVLYKTFFDREGEAGGKTYWTNEMASGRKTKVDVIYGFINSEEWANICLTYGIKSGTDVKPTITITPNQNIKNFAERLYTTCLNRSSEAEGLNYWANELSNLRKSGSEVAKGFFFSEELVNSGISDAEFLTRLYKTVMGRDPEPAGYNYWLGEMKAGRMSRNDVFDGFAASEEWIGICADYGILR